MQASHMKHLGFLTPAAQFSTSNTRGE